jgi:SAM-dependent methyltransferase
MTTRWQLSEATRGDEYDAQWEPLAASGQNVHGEADLVQSLLTETGGHTVLDAGCGTGRVAIELARRGFAVTGVDADPAMLQTARTKSPGLAWAQVDLAEPAWPAGVPGHIDLVLLAGNVMIFLGPETEGRVLANLAARLRPDGLLVAGFQLRPDGLTLRSYDRLTGDAGLVPVARWSTWDRDPFDGGDYAVSVHRRMS